MKWEYKTVLEDIPMWASIQPHMENKDGIVWCIEYARHYYYYFKRFVREDD